MNETPKLTLTYSSLAVLRSCPRKYKHQYIDRLSPVQKDADNLYFGTMMHRALETWYGCDNADFAVNLALEAIDEQCKERDTNPDVKRMWHIARAMLKAYILQYGRDCQWEIIDVEQEFNGAVVNPRTEAESKTFDMKGKIDLIVRPMGSEDIYLVDHKTLSMWTEKEIDRLSMDTQMAVYVHYLRQSLGAAVRGFCYNVLVKPTIKQRIGETEEEFRVRYEEACAKNKSGKSTAKQEMPESDEEFQQRLADWFDEKPRFHRVIVDVPESRMRTVREELWDATQDFLARRLRNTWSCNPAACYQYYRPCDYLPLCRCGSEAEANEIKKELFGLLDSAHPEFEEWTA